MRHQANARWNTIRFGAAVPRLTWSMRSGTTLLALIAVCVAAPTAIAQVRLEAEAFSGTPFGVGRITLQSGGEFRFNPNRIPRQGGKRAGRVAELAKRLLNQPDNEPGLNLDSAELALVEKSERVFYPVFEKRERPILRQFINTPSRTTIYFLFQGDAPLDLTFYSPDPTSGPVTPRNDPAGHQRLLAAWWADYAAAAEGHDAPIDYPPMVEEYLADTLARRLKLTLPPKPEPKSAGLLGALGGGPMETQFNLLFQTERARVEMAEKILLSDLGGQAATEILPEELPLPKPESLNPPADTPIEPIALHVPVECFYVRFGNFPNFLWLRHRLEDWGGQLRNIVSQRGLDYGLNERFQRQLGLRESELAEVLGEKVIADVALIGTDLSMREGASVGMLFQAKNNLALGTDLKQQRFATLKEEKQGKHELVKIAGRQVSFISTPDNRLRSFYVNDGEFHLVTTSRTLVEWFLATGAGKHDSIGKSEAFRYARASLPLERNDTVFVYLAPEFFQNLLNPHYHIELNRRLRAAVEIELFEIARLTARSEQKPGATIDELIASDLLPRGFGQRPDGSQLLVEEGRISDSLRGGRGTFLPVPDVPIGKITAAELAEHEKFSANYAEQYGPMDPIMAAVRREALPDAKLERVVLDLKAAPLSPKHVQRIGQWLGEPTDQRLARVPGDLVAFEAVMRGGTFFSGDEHHLFGALRDGDPAAAMAPGPSLLGRLVGAQLQGAEGYLGAWPNPGLLRIISGWVDPPSNSPGMTRLLSGLWRNQFSGFTMLSFHPEVLQQASPQLRFEKAPRPAQIWFRSDDLVGSKVAPLVNAYGYRQARQVTRGNTRYLNMLSDQLHVPGAESRAIGERLLAARLESPLGGDYELRDFGDGLSNWVSTALEGRGDEKQPPADYQFPALNWLRGIQFELAVRNQQLVAHGEFIMPVETRPTPQVQMPGLPFGKKPAAKPQPPAPSAEAPATSAPSTPPQSPTFKGNSSSGNSPSAAPPSNPAPRVVPPPPAPAAKGLRKQGF